MSWLDRIFHRKRIRQEALINGPFPDEWLCTVRRTVSSYTHLPDDHRRILRERIQVFMAEKGFLGIGNLTITEEIKITIAAPACLLLIGIPHLGVYPRLHEVIVYPHDFGEVTEAVGPDGRRYRIPQMRSGEAWRRGPVVLAWNSVRHSVEHPRDGCNVVFHEFAHVLDMNNGAADGLPPLETKEQIETWTSVLDAEFSAFSAAIRHGKPTLLDPYGASNPAEFFAVVTEHFFEQPRLLRRRHPKLYEQFSGFYRQDPAVWKESRSSHWT